MTPRGAEDIELRLLLDAIYQRYHYDFREYSEASLKRRTSSALGFFGDETISRLQERVLRDPRAFAHLLKFLTVQVSELFRDPAYFRTIRERVVPYLRTYPSIKVWVAGCATGEEAYSLAILFAEESLLDRAIIYATGHHPEERLRVGRSKGLSTSNASRGFSKDTLAGGRQGVAVGLLHGALLVGAARPETSRRRSSFRTIASRRTRSSPRSSSSRAATCSSTSTASCRIARSGSCTTRSVARDFWAWASRRPCGSLRMPMRSPILRRPIASTRGSEGPSHERRGRRCETRSSSADPPGVALRRAARRSSRPCHGRVPASPSRSSSTCRPHKPSALVGVLGRRLRAPGEGGEDKEPAAAGDGVRRAAELSPPDRARPAPSRSRSTPLGALLAAVDRRTVRIRGRRLRSVARRCLAHGSQRGRRSRALRALIRADRAAPPSVQSPETAAAVRIMPGRPCSKPLRA